jgi:hypothetical protein
MVGYLEQGHQVPSMGTRNLKAEYMSTPCTQKIEYVEYTLFQIRTIDFELLLS